MWLGATLMYDNPPGSPGACWHCVNDTSHFITALFFLQWACDHFPCFWAIYLSYGGIPWVLRGVYAHCFPKRGLNFLKDNDKTTFSWGKFSWFLESKYFDNSSDVSHRHKTPVIVRNDKGAHSYISKVVNPWIILIWKAGRWQAMPPFSW